MWRALFVWRTVGHHDPQLSNGMTMTAPILQFERRPSAIVFMLRALYPSPGLHSGEDIPPVRATWSKHRLDQAHLHEFLSLTGLTASRGLPILYPHVFGFRLIMAVLTHPAFPLPIWRALQIRNQLRQLEWIDLDSVLDLRTEIAAHRVLEKGVEIDLLTTITRRDRPVWEGTTTFYYRGRFASSQAPPSDARPPEVGDGEIARWRTLPPVGWRFARLTGDYNGIHSWNWYARLFGFRKAFYHPQLILGQCLARLPQAIETPAQQLDAWLRGPVEYDTDVRLAAREQFDGFAFALNTARDARPAIIGSWRGVRP